MAVTLAHCFICALGFTIFVYRIFENIPINIQNLSSNQLHAFVASSDVCDVTAAGVNRGLFVRNESMEDDILGAKFATFFDKKYLLKLLSDQVQFLHVVDEAILTKRFVKSFCSMIFFIGVIEVLVVQRMGNLIKNYEKSRALAKSLAFEHTKCIREYFQDKCSILIFCIIRTHSPVNQKHYIDFGEYVRDTISLRSRSTDLTFFTCWFCLLAIIHVTTHSMFYRYVDTIPLLDRPMMTRLRYQPVYIAMFFTLISLLSFSTILLGAAGMSYAFLNPDYATILTLESYRVCIRCFYVIHRLSQSLSTVKMNQIENMKDITEKEIADLVALGSQEKRFGIKSFYVNSTVLASLILSVYYAVIGLMFNRKVFAMGFVYEFSRIIHEIFRGQEYGYDELL